MTIKMTSKDEMPEEIWAYITSGSNCRHWKKSEIKWGWHHQNPTKYIRAALSAQLTKSPENVSKQELTNAPLPNDVAEAVEAADGWLKGLHTDHKRYIDGVKTLIRAASTPSVPVDTISVPREVLQGVREALKESLPFMPKSALFENANRVHNLCIQALASLDAVLAEGE